MMDLQSVSLKVVWKYMDVVYSITFPPFELKRNSGSITKLLND